MQKMRKKRLRIFAGPNGSGKSTLFEEFSKNYNTGYFINADHIENTLATKGFIDLEDYNIKSTQQDLDSFFEKVEAQTLIEKSKISGHIIDVEIRENLIVDQSKSAHSYEGALVAMFLREKLIENNESFCFETVMSHRSKLKEIEDAKKLGYTTYLYFVCIDDPEINISRIENRVDKGGHTVADEKVVNRYPKTLENLYPAISLCNKSYLFDNSGEELTLIAEIQDNSFLKLAVDEAKLPNWFKIYVLNHYL
jgi:Uncharacterized protein conserved in bacteria